jgi:DMSO/TMAO reductase YedYZ molybdopterin-dependent catalytic subunit
MSISNITTNMASGHDFSRRALLKSGGAGLTALSLVGSAMLGRAFALQPGDRAFALQPGDKVIPWSDRRAESPMPDVIRNQQEWEELVESWITPNERFFGISRYNEIPEIDAATWRLSVGGRVSKPVTLALEDIRKRPRAEVTATIECAGTHGLPFLEPHAGDHDERVHLCKVRRIDQWACRAGAASAFTNYGNDELICQVQL